MAVLDRHDQHVRPPVAVIHHMREAVDRSGSDFPTEDAVQLRVGADHVHLVSNRLGEPDPQSELLLFVGITGSLDIVRGLS